mgnify:CR=1 FL=1
MGQKVNPIGMRLQVNRTWDSRWFAESKDYGNLLLEDLEMRRFINEECKQAGISKVIIEAALLTDDEKITACTLAKAAALMAALGGHLCAEWGARFTVTGEPDPRAAIAGARFVFSAIRPGQEGARAVDEEVPLKHSILLQS